MLRRKFEMLDLFVISLLMTGIFFGLAMLSLHGMGEMNWLAGTMFGSSVWCMICGWGIFAYNMEG
jgi:hypothetical protein